MEKDLTFPSILTIDLIQPSVRRLVNLGLVPDVPVSQVAHPVRPDPRRAGHLGVKEASGLACCWPRRRVPAGHVQRLVDVHLPHGGRKVGLYFGVEYPEFDKIVIPFIPWW